MKDNRTFSFAVIAAIYIAAAVIGIALFGYYENLHIFWRILIADAGATVFVYLTGVFLQNASVYDPYWSVAPIFIVTASALHFEVLNAGVILLLAAVWFWGVRLTCNWAYTFKNLNIQDWRYDYYKRKFPRLFQLVSFVGINMFPTAIVFGCLLPAIEFMQNSAFNMLTVVGFAVCAGAATLQLVADFQMHRFKRNAADSREIIREGLWKYARHPNYLGEILMWWGVYVMALSANGEAWYLGIGSLANTVMFLIVSIPLADNRNRQLRDGFDEYVSETRALLPIKKT